MMSEDEILNRVVALFPELTVKELLGSGAEGNVYLVVEESTLSSVLLKRDVYSKILIIQTW